MYCGQTKQTFTGRWGSNGNGYTVKKKGKCEPKQRKIANAIKKYGWNNFSHIIIVENIPKEKADEIEIFIIDKFELLTDKKGYNISKGGNSNSISEEMKKQMSESHLKRKVIGISLKDKSVHKFNSIKDANKFIESKNALVNACLKKGIGSTSKGFIWLYSEDFDENNIDLYFEAVLKMKENRYSFNKNQEYKEKRRQQQLKMNKNGEISKLRNPELSFKKIVRINPETKDFTIFQSKTEGAKSVNGSLGAISCSSKNGKFSLIKGYIWVNYSDFKVIGLDTILDKYKKGETLWS